MSETKSDLRKACEAAARECFPYVRNSWVKEYSDIIERHMTPVVKRVRDATIDECKAVVGRMLDAREAIGIHPECEALEAPERRIPMTEAEKNEMLYVDTSVPRCPLCRMPVNGEAESHLPDCQLRALQESYANALVAAAVEACKQACIINRDSCGDSHTDCHGSDANCMAVVTPEAAAKELGRIKAEARLKQMRHCHARCAQKHLVTELEQENLMAEENALEIQLAALEAAARKEE